MRKATKTIISLAVILIAGLNFIVPAFAQDPFTAIAIGGVGGASGSGLFGSMAMASGIDIDYVSDPVNDAMWNKLNPDSVYFSGEKHEADPLTDPEDIYDYINVDIGDWLSAQSDFIIAFAQENNVTDNDSGTATSPRSYGSFPIDSNGYAYIGTAGFTEGTVNFGGIQITRTLSGTDTMFNYVTYLNGSTASYSDVLSRSNYGNAVPYYIYVSGENVKLVALKNNGTYQNCCSARNDFSHINNDSNVNWSSGIVNTSVFDGWESAKVKIPHSISGLSTGWTVPEFMNVLDEIWYGHGEDNIIIENGGEDPPVPPQPIPDTPLGDVPFDDWVDLWGQSIWDQLTRLEEKQELMVIGQEDGLESLEDLQGIGHDALEDFDDIIGLETDINENLEDMITYEQGISTDVDSIDENVEDIEDETIIIVDEMGNVIDVLEGLDAKAYAQGQKLGEISTEVGTVASTTEAISTEVEAQTETQAEIKEAVEDMVPYVAPLPDIATDIETLVDILPDIATATQTSTQTLTDTLPDIKDATQTMTDTLPDIITEIQDATTTLTDDIPNIDDICENIDEAPYKDLDNGLDRLPRFLLPFITDLRSALGIWHYVTEWLAQISTTFAFISGCLVGTSIMTPIYAAIAGFMCIKIYRRMTA